MELYNKSLTCKMENFFFFDLTVYKQKDTYIKHQFTHPSRECKRYHTRRTHLKINVSQWLSFFYIYLDEFLDWLATYGTLIHLKLQYFCTFTAHTLKRKQYCYTLRSSKMAIIKESRAVIKTVKPVDDLLELQVDHDIYWHGPCVSLQGHVWHFPKKVKASKHSWCEIEPWLVRRVQVVGQFYKENGSPSSYGNKLQNVIKLMASCRCPQSPFTNF